MNTDVYDERGVSYVMVLFTVAVLGTLCLSFTLMTGFQREVTANFESSEHAHYLARAGLNVAIWHVLNEPGFVEANDGVPISYTFQDMPLTYVVQKATNNESILVTSVASVRNATTTLRHLLVPSVCMIAYGEGMHVSPRYRRWYGATWSGEAAANAVDNEICWIVLRSCPVRNEKTLGSLDHDNHIFVQAWDESSWGPTTQLATYCTDSYRGFDIAYETVSGDALAVYKRALAETDVYYRVWNGSAWSSETILDLPTGGEPRWVTMASNPNSDEIVIAVLDDQWDIVVSVWDGDTFTNTTIVETDASTAERQCMDVAYESLTGKAMVVWGETGAGNPRYRIWDGLSWSAEGSAPDIGFELEWMKLCSDPTTNRILLGTLDSGSDVNVAFWDGTAWEPRFEVETAAETISSRCFDVAFERSDSEAMVAWSDSGDHSVDYRVWTSGSWSGEQTGPNVGNDIKIIQLVPSSHSDAVFMTTKTDDNDLEVTKWNGSGWGPPDKIETNSSGGLDYESFMLAY